MLGLDQLSKFLIKIYDGLKQGIFTVGTSITSVTISSGSFNTATMIDKDGTQTQVKLDTTGSTTVPMPVEIFGILRTPTKTTVLTSGTVTSGARSVSLITSSNLSGTILGDEAQQSSVYSFSDMEGLTAIDYNIYTGSIEIIEIR